MICRGDIYYAKLSPVIGSEQGGLRPVLVLQNNIGNRRSPTIIAAPITSKRKKRYLPTHVTLSDGLELPCRSMVLLEQIRVLDKRRLREFLDHVEEDDMEKIDKAIHASLALFYGGTKQSRTEEKRLCLCPTCAGQFYSSPDHVIRQVEPRENEDSTCDYCEVQPGFHFLVINRRKRLGDC